MGNRNRTPKMTVTTTTTGTPTMTNYDDDGDDSVGVAGDADEHHGKHDGRCDARSKVIMTNIAILPRGGLRNSLKYIHATRFATPVGRKRCKRPSYKKITSKTSILVHL